MGLRLDQRPFSKVTVVVFATLVLSLFNRVLVSSEYAPQPFFICINFKYYRHYDIYAYYRYCTRGVSPAILVEKLTMN